MLTNPRVEPEPVTFEAYLNAWRIATNGADRREGDGYRGPCPCCQGKSFTVKPASNGTPLLHCWSGCGSDFAQFIEAVGLEPCGPRDRPGRDGPRAVPEPKAADPEADSTGKDLVIWEPGDRRQSYGNPIREYADKPRVHDYFRSAEDEAAGRIYARKICYWTENPGSRRPKSITWWRFQAGPPIEGTSRGERWLDTSGGEPIWRMVRSKPGPPEKAARKLFDRTDVGLYNLPGFERYLETDRSDPVLLVGGEKDADTGQALGLCAVSCPHGETSLPKDPRSRELLRGVDLAIVYDDDEAGRRGGQQIAADLANICGSVRIVDPSELVKLTDSAPEDIRPQPNTGADLTDVFEILREDIGIDACRAALLALIERSEIIGRPGIGEDTIEDPGGPGGPTSANAEPSGPWDIIKPMSLREVLEDQTPPPSSLTEGDVWTAEQLAMVYAPRGIGKTWFGMSLAVAMATGSELCGWQVVEPVPVLYVDGEMAFHMQRDRFAQLVKGSGSATAEAPLSLLSNVRAHRAHNIGLPDLGGAEGQQWLERLLGPARVLVLDNLSSLIRASDESEGSDWSPVANWLVSLRASGLCVVMVHHANKSGDQRGTSRREDALDLVMKLGRPDDYEAEDGCRMTLEITKARSLSGVQVAPLILTLTEREAGGLWFDWQYRNADARARALQIFRADPHATLTEISSMLASEGLEPPHRATISRWLKPLREGRQ